jgi:hypothetical protein
MKWTAIQWGSELYEWVMVTSGHWSLIGHDAVVFSTTRGWGVMVQGKFLSYYPTRKKAMEAAIGYLAYERRKKEAEAV